MGHVPYITVIHFILFYFIVSEEEIGDPEGKEYAHVTLDDLTRVETLGMGGFGRVELVSG